MADATRRFFVEAVIGRGGTGTVYRARDLDSGQHHALKFLGRKMVSTGTLQRLRDEARVLASIRDRAVVKAEPPTLVGGRWAVVMEYLGGVPTSKLLRVKPYPPRVAAAIIGELARALDGIYHAKGQNGRPLHVLHRDIKPGNIHLSKNGYVRLLDFGTAKADLQLNEADSGRLMGTVGYVAPERMERIEGPASDVYSLGVTLHVLVTGEKAMGPGRYRPRWHRVQRTDAVQRVLDLASEMQAVDPADRLLAQEVVARCSELVAALEGPTLAEWCHVNVPDDIRLSDDVLVGTTLVESLEEEQSSSHIGGTEDVFVGRHREVRQLDSLHKGDARVLTVYGAPGVGKTRLALHWANERKELFPGGVKLCRCREARDARTLLATVASALGVVAMDGDLEEQILGAIRNRGKVLIILDNVDHVLALVRRYLTHWQSACAEATFFVSSTRPISVGHDAAVALQALPFPSTCPNRVSDCMDAPAIRLFVVRAQVVNPHFRLNSSTAQAVLILWPDLMAYRLRSLAAAHVRLAPLIEIRDKIVDKQLADTVIQSGLQSELDWFWGVLEPWERATLAQLSVFASGFHPRCGGVRCGTPPVAGSCLDERGD